MHESRTVLTRQGVRSGDLVAGLLGADGLNAVFAGFPFT
jgi:hypothetical protein